MKTLSQVEPRTLIDTLPFVITEPGSYYLAKTLVYTNDIATNGITIASDDVILDLRGFALISTSTNTARGIFVAYKNEDPWRWYNITIKNGVVRGWGEDGVNASDADDSSVLDVKALRNGGWGILAGPNSLIARCSARENGLCGIEAGQGSSILDCKAKKNGDDGPPDEGIYMNMGGRVIGCSADDNKHGIWANMYCTVRDNTALWNNGHGIRVGSSCRVEANNCGNNAYGGSGDYAGIFITGSGNRIERNNVNDNYRGIRTDTGSSGGNFVIGNTANGNNYAGYSLHGDDFFGPILVGGTDFFGGSGITQESPYANFEY